MSKKLALALGGGGARGLYHIGVIKALEDNNIKISAVAGTSIGALIGAVYVSSRLEKLEKIILDLNIKKVIQLLDLSFLKNGILDGKKLEKLLRTELLLDNIEDTKIPFFAVATDLMSGEEIILNKGSLVKAVRASISIPGLFTSVEINNKHLADGGLLNPVPISVLRKEKYDVILAIDLNKEISSFKEIISEKSSFLDKIFSKIKNLGPNIFDVLIYTINIMQRELTRKNILKYPADFLIEAKLGNIKLFDFHLGKILIERGYSDTLKKVDDIKKALN